MIWNIFTGGGGMKKDVVDFVACFLCCQQVKVEHKKLGGFDSQIT